MSAIVWHKTEIDKDARSNLKNQRPCIVWFTGLSGSGKSSVANRVETKLAQLGRHTYLLDGDNIRHGLSSDLGFSIKDREENIRRVAECAAMFVDAGLIVLAAFISPFRAERALARSLVAVDEFVEVFVDTPLNVCEARDPKGLYRKARAGLVRDFTGVDSPYERPVSPEVLLNGDGSHTIDSMADQVVAVLLTHRQPVSVNMGEQ